MEKYVFGHYPQNGRKREPISWLVLERQKGRLVLLSEYVLDGQSFCENGNRWESSDLRKWLNNGFLNSAFTPAQQQVIVSVARPCGHQEGHELCSDPPVADAVSLLDVTELKIYFPRERSRTAKATEYAQAKGITISTAADCCDWWLRSPGCQMITGMDGWASKVESDGELKPWGILTTVGIRPLITVDEAAADACYDEEVEEQETEEEASDDTASLAQLLRAFQQLSEVLNRNADSEDSTPPRFPDAVPPKHLYQHYTQVNPATSSLAPFANLGVKVMINDGGTEYDPLYLNELEAIQSSRFQQNILQFMRKDHYQLDQTAKELAEVFRVDKSVFDARHDRLSDILAGNLAKIYTLSALRSFAWTLAAMAEQDERDIDQYSMDELNDLIEFIEEKEWLNYDDSGRFKALCDHPDLHVFYVPNSMMTEAEIEQFQSEIRNLPVCSLEALRECLSLLEPVMRKLADDLAIGRNSLEPLTGGKADILYAWCSLCVAAQHPYFVEDGPMVCFYSYPTTEKGETPSIPYRVEESTPISKREAESSLDVYGHEKSQDLKKVEATIDHVPSISFVGKHFVLSNFFDGDENGRMAQRIKEAGGILHSSMVKMADYLVINTQRGYYGIMNMTKFNKALEWRTKGSMVKIITGDMADAALRGTYAVHTDKPDDDQEALQNKAEFPETEEANGKVPTVETVAAELPETYASPTDEPDDDQEAMRKKTELLEKLESLAKQAQIVTEKTNALYKLQQIDEEWNAKQEELNQKRRAIAEKEKPDDAVHMYISLRNEKAMDSLSRDDDSFAEIYKDDFFNLSKDELLALRKRVASEMDDGGAAGRYEETFRQESFELRLQYSALNYLGKDYADGRVFDYDAKAEEAYQMWKHFFNESERKQVRVALMEELRDTRQSVEDQIRAIKPDWIEFKEAKRCIFPTIYSVEDFPFDDPDNRFQYHSGESVVALMLYDQGEFVPLFEPEDPDEEPMAAYDPQYDPEFTDPDIALVNQMCWWWRTSVQEIWSVAENNGYVDKRELKSNGGTLYREAKEAVANDHERYPNQKMDASFQVERTDEMKPVPQKTAYAVPQPAPAQPKESETAKRIRELEAERDSIRGMLGFIKRNKLQKEIDRLKELL